VLHTNHMNNISKSQFKEAVKQIIRECLQERQFAESADKVSPLDFITRLVVKRGLQDPQKMDYLITQLYQHQSGKSISPGEVAASIQRNKGVTETAYKIQGASGKTFEDSPQLPDAQNNPKNA
jgi:hypothetical protein